MFTGIIEEVGEIAAIDDSGEFRTLRVRAGAILDGRCRRQYCGQRRLPDGSYLRAGSFTAGLSERRWIGPA